MTSSGFNGHGVKAIYRFEMARSMRTLWQSLVTPVITTALYFVVFGAAIGGRMKDMDGISFGAFIVPGLTLLSVFMQSIFNASFGIYFPAVTKSMVLALVTLVTATIFVDVRVEHPAMMLLFLALITIAFSLLGFVIGIWAQNFEQLQIIPMMIVTPLTFLGGAFYSTSALAEPWRTVTLFNPVVYLISGFRWTFFGKADVPVWSSVAVMVGIIAACLAGIAWVFKTGYRLKQ